MTRQVNKQGEEEKAKARHKADLDTIRLVAAIEPSS